MQTESPAEKRSLTLEDPIDVDVLKKFKELQEARRGLAENFLALEQEKIHILSAVKKIDLQISRLFETANVERGLAPNTGVSIDAVTGLMTLDEVPTSG